MSFEQLVKILEVLVPLLSTILSIIAITIAILTLRREKKRFSTSIETDIFFKFSERFTSEEFRRKRKRLAKRMDEVQKARKKENKLEERCLEKDELIDFFQVTGLIYRSRNELMDIKLLHSKFTWWLSHYFLFFEREITSQIEQDKGLWEDAVWLHQQFLDLNKLVGRTVDKKSLKKFIIYEKEL